MHQRIEINDQEIGKAGECSITVASGGSSQSGYVDNKIVLVGAEQLMQVGVASGRENIYNYIELYNIEDKIKVNHERIAYYGSDAEDKILGFFAGFLGRADLIHVEYAGDLRTWDQLQAGVPMALSRLGFKLFNLGFTWFKDFYIAEGWKEGPVKLTAQKPLDVEMVQRNLSDIKGELQDYLDKKDSEKFHKKAERVLSRIKKISADPSAILK